MERDRRPVWAEKDFNPTIDRTSRSISSHAPRRIISTDPLQEYYETKSGAKCRTLEPGFSFEIILVSHNYRVAVVLLASIFTVGSVFGDILVVVISLRACTQERETEQGLSEGKRLLRSGKKQKVFKHPLLLVSLFSLAVSLICGVE